MPPEDEALATIRAQSRTMIVHGAVSCRDGANHVSASKEAVARSMQLLSKTKRHNRRP